MHLKSIDHILPNKVRITLDSASGTMINAQVKQNLGHLSIHQPNRAMDIRISANVEVPVSLESVKDQDLSQPAIIKRKKDRISYEVSSGFLTVDLTQVTQTQNYGGNAGNNQVKHELEVEVIDPKKLMDSPEAFQSFVDSIRELCQLIK